LNLPVVSLGETQVRPAALLWRNMAAMAMEEMFRANPIDGLVCSAAATRPSRRWMAAASVDLPAVVSSGGPMLNGTFRGQALGCGTDVWRLSEEVRAGTLSSELFLRSESSMIRSRGHCNTMGTASSMSIMAEALGMTIAGLAGTPAADSRLLEGAHESGRLAVKLVQQGRTISRVITRASFHNAIVTLAAIGGSTNAVVHLLAIAGRLGIEVSLEDFDRIGTGVPLLVTAADRKVADGRAARGARPDHRSARPDCDHREGRLPRRGCRWAPCLGRRRHHPSGAAPARRRRHRCAARNLAPRGAIVKPAAATPELLVHRGPAVVFDSVEDLHARIDDPALPVTPDSVLVLRGCGPKGYPGMPEVANLPLPRKMLQLGIRDMVRVCDGRMSGTAYRTVVLQVAPEAAAGGLLELVQDGDPIVLDVPRRLLQLDVPEEELIRRTPAPTVMQAFAAPTRGWERLYVDHRQQADTGANLDFLVGATGPVVARESH
jgi:dihydroxyacid dehydratase/phosphogluconate dehydratase